MKNPIGWCDKTWNFITGCTKISAGCQNCYAERMSKRLAGRFGYPKENPFEVTLHEDKLISGLPSAKSLAGKIVFVNSMSDLFHEKALWLMGEKGEYWEYAYQHMLTLMRHFETTKFIILTKRPQNIPKWMLRAPSNVWIGVSVENAETVSRIETLHLLWPGKKLVSFEPLIGEIPGVEKYLPMVDWVIVGPETGPKKRPYPRLTAHNIHFACAQLGITFYDKHPDAPASFKRRPA